jgi:chromosome segregation ATPase
VIQSTLFFILGFLSATFLALMVAPAVWRRAVALTRKRIEASTPLTLNEMQAEADRARAEGAMAIRRLEISMKALKERAADQLIELNRSREELRRLTGETTGKSEQLTGLEARVPELLAKLSERDEQIAALSARLREADELIEKRAAELNKLGQTYEEVTFLSSSRQIEIAGRESEIDKMSIDLSRLRSQRKDMELRLAEFTADNAALKETVMTERKRVAELEKKIERLLSEGYREQEPSGLRSDGAEIDANDSGLKSARVVSDGQPLAGRNGEADANFARLTAERDRLESRLTTLTRENKKLRQKTAADGSGMEAAGDALLRDQIHQLAAEVVSLTAMLDEPDSPIRKALSTPAADVTASEAAGGFPSLAARVRALQKASGN